MLRVMVSLVLVLLCMGCDPAVCGHVSINDVDSNPDIERYRQADGSIGLLEFCGSDFGSFTLSRADLGTTTLTLDSDVAGLYGAEASPIARVVLPSASVVFWTAHLAPGTTLMMAQLAGGGLHKRSEAQLYQVHLLSSAKLEILEGPLNHREKKVIDTVEWTEEWRIRWAFEFGSGKQRWEGEDLVSRSGGPEVGTNAFTPPDPRP